MGVHSTQQWLLCNGTCVSGNELCPIVEREQIIAPLICVYVCCVCVVYVCVCVCVCVRVCVQRTQVCVCTSMMTGESQRE